MRISCISLEDIRRRVATFIRTYFIMIWLRSNGMMLVRYRVVKFQVKGQIIRWSFGTAVFMSMVAMTERNDLVICLSVVLRIKSINGRKFIVKVFSHLIGLVTLQWFTKTQCLFSEGGTGMTQ